MKVISRKVRRGDIAMVYFPYSDDTTRVKQRPVLIVQADSIKTELPNVVVVPLTSQMSRLGLPCRVHVKVDESEAKGTGLRYDSVIMVDRVQQIDIDAISHVIGRMPEMTEVDDALRATLAL